MAELQNAAEWQRRAMNAREIQDACNPLGLSKSFADEVQSLYEAMGRPGFDVFRSDPRVQTVLGAWISKLDSLFGFPSTDLHTFDKLDGMAEFAVLPGWDKVETSTE